MLIAWISGLLPAVICANVSQGGACNVQETGTCCDTVGGPALCDCNGVIYTRVRLCSDVKPAPKNVCTTTPQYDCVDGACGYGCK